jgi:hypothetical protein
MQDLPVDRGYPVPWFVEWIRSPEGENLPEFRAMSMVKWKLAVTQKLCWVCGKRLGAHIAFVVGPMCGINRISAEPPSHLECAEWSARNCPFLSRPHMERRDTGDLDIAEPAGHMIKRNPGVTLVWVTRDYEVFKEGKGVLIEMGNLEALSFWAEGKPATRAQIEASITTGLPSLLEKARDERDVREIQAMAARFRALLPAG